MRKETCAEESEKYSRGGTEKSLKVKGDWGGIQKSASNQTGKR